MNNASMQSVDKILLFKFLTITTDRVDLCAYLGIEPKPETAREATKFLYRFASGTAELTPDQWYKIERLISRKLNPMNKAEAEFYLEYVRRQRNLT